jgi:hypothetical protein
MMVFSGKLVSNNMTDMKTPIEFVTGLYTEGHLNAQSIVGALRKVVKLYNFDEDEITLILQVDRENKPI